MSILAWLNNNGIMPPRRYMHSIGLASAKETGALTEWWSLRTVRDTLRNKVYCGIMIQGKSKVIGGVPTKLPESEWTVTENTHEAIVSREMFDLVQELWVRKNPATEPYYKSPNTENVFAHKMFCGQCGHALIRKRGGENYYRYLCNVNIYYSKSACSGVTITETAMKEAALETIRKHEPFLSQALLQENGPASVCGNHKSELEIVLCELENTQRYLKGLYEALVGGDITNDEYKDMKGAYETKIASLTERKVCLRESAHVNDQQKKAIQQAHNSIKTIKRASDLTAGIIDKLIEKIIVYSDGRIEFKLRFLDEVVCVNGREQVRFPAKAAVGGRKA